MLTRSQSLEDSGNNDNVPQALKQQGKRNRNVPEESKNLGSGHFFLTHIKTKQN